MFSLHRLGNLPIALLAICLTLSATCSLSRATETHSVITAQTPVSFEKNVTASLDKAGCNLGACHGNQRGKGGFQLSLRGESPAEDFRSLVLGENGRRINTLDAEQSLILLKGLGILAHEGGKRFSKDSPTYQNLLAWIRSGAPAPQLPASLPIALRIIPEQLILPPEQASVQLNVVAVWPDGSSQDVTSLAVYEALDPSVKITADGLVQPSRRGSVPILVRYLGSQSALQMFFSDRPLDKIETPKPATWIDEPIQNKLAAVGAQQTIQAPDEILVRRLYIDLLGRIPTAEEAKTFAQSDEPNKQAQLVDRLLASPDFVIYWAMKWSDVLRCDEKVLDPDGVKHFSNWIRQSIQDAMPVDQFARDILTATGSTYNNPPANFYRALRDPQSRGEAVARVFLGYRLQCAQCHNHPFDQWTQADYYSWSSAFSGIDYEIKSNDRKDDLDKNEFRGEQIVQVKQAKPQKHPRTGEALFPKVLDQNLQPLPETEDPRRDLAHWLTAPQNLQFARTQVNWIFFHLMGRGIVDPVDDFRSTNPPSHPELLDEMARRWIDHQYDLRWLIREIVLSQTYQLDSNPPETTPLDASFFSHRIVARHTAEVLADAQSDVLGIPLPFDQQPPGTRAVALRAGQREQRYLKSAGDAFLGIFGKPQRLTACECERSNDLSLSQVFQLMQGESLEKRIHDNKGRIRKLAESDRSSAEILTELYWCALSRPPSSQELEQAVAAAEHTESKREWLEDVTWALLNSQEFLLHH